MDVASAIRAMEKDRRPMAYREALRWATGLGSPHILAASLEQKLLDALRSMNGPVFWGLVEVGANGYLNVGWRPRDEALWETVKDTALFIALEESETVTTGEVAFMLGCSDVHVRRLVRNGTLRGVKVKTKPVRWDVDSESVFAYIDGKAA